MPLNTLSRYHTYIKPVVKNKFVQSSTPHIFTLLTIIILTLFAIRPTISTILNLQKNVVEQKKVLEGLNKKVQSLTEGKRNLEALSPESKSKISQAIPDNPSVVFLIRSLQNTSQTQASASGIQIQPVTLLDNSLPSQEARLNLGEVEFSFNNQGPFSQLVDTLSNVSKAPRIISLTSVLMSKQSDSQPVLSITGKSYYLTPKEQAK